MMQRKWILSDIDKIDEVVAWLQVVENIEAISEKIHYIEINEYSKNRTVAQNKLYWKWLTAISEHTGHTKDEMHEIYKERFLVKIFERDNTEYAEMIQTLRKLYKEHPEDSIMLFKHVTRLTSTTQANVKQFTEYLRDIEQDCFSNQIPLPMPDDEYKLAMGVR